MHRFNANVSYMLLQGFLALKPDVFNYVVKRYLQYSYFNSVYTFSDNEL